MQRSVFVIKRKHLPEQKRSGRTSLRKFAKCLSASVLLSKKKKTISAKTAGCIFRARNCSTKNVAKLRSNSDSTSHWSECNKKFSWARLQSERPLKSVGGHLRKKTLIPFGWMQRRSTLKHLYHCRFRACTWKIAVAQRSVSRKSNNANGDFKGFRTRIPKMHLQENLQYFQLLVQKGEFTF